MLVFLLELEVFLVLGVGGDTDWQWQLVDNLNFCIFRMPFVWLLQISDYREEDFELDCDYWNFYVALNFSLNYFLFEILSSYALLFVSFNMLWVQSKKE